MQARWIHTAAICWCSQHLTDGIIPRRQAWKLGAEDESSRPGEWIDELLRASLFEIAGPDAYRVHDFLEYNPSKEEVEQARWASTEQRRRAGQARAQSGTRDAKGRLLPSGQARPSTADSPAEPPAESSGPLASLGPAEPAPFPFPVPVFPINVPELSEAHSPAATPAAPPARAAIRRQDSSPRASAREEAKPEASSERPTNVQRTTGPPALTDDECERLDRLRNRILASKELDGHLESIDRVIVAHLRRGAPYGAVEQGLASVLEHTPRAPAAYLAKVLRVEVPNHHEAAAIARHQALKDAEARARSAPTAAVAHTELEQIGGPLAAVLGRIAPASQR